MPLAKGKSSKSIGKNIEIMEKSENKPHKQAVAIALNVARKAGAKIPKKKGAWLKQQNRYVTFKQAADEGIFPGTENSIRSLFANRKTNGFDKVVRRVGARKLVISVNDLMDWLENSKLK